MPQSFSPTRESNQIAGQTQAYPLPNYRRFLIIGFKLEIKRAEQCPP